MNRLFVRGDTHGNFDFIEYFCEEYDTTTDDVLVILGDAGILYYGEKSTREKYLHMHLAKQPITLFCVRGNHESRPEDRDYPVEYCDLVGGYAYHDPHAPNIWYAVDGGIYNCQGHSFLTIGGAYSVDKDYRLAMGWYWNPREQLDEAERKEIMSEIKDTNVEWIFTHTCPTYWEPVDLFLGGIDQSTVDTTMEHWLEDVAENVSCEKWFFGHFHANRNVLTGKVYMLFDKIKQLI